MRYCLKTIEMTQVCGSGNSDFNNAFVCLFFFFFFFVSVFISQCTVGYMTILSPFWKGLYCKRKEFTLWERIHSFKRVEDFSLWEQIVPLTVDPFQKRLGVQEDKQKVIKNYILCQYGRHYENMPIQIYWKFYHQRMIVFRWKILIFFILLLKK